MSSGFGLSRMMSGAVEGLNQTEARRDRASDREYQDVQRQRQDTQFSQGQEDRQYALARRDVETARADDQYKTQKDKQDRYKAGSEAMREWLTTGDVEGINKFANQYTRDGVDQKLVKNEDGTYSAAITVDGKGGDLTPVTEDDVGIYMQTLMSADPYADLKEQQGLKRQRQAKNSDRAFDMAKMEREYELKTGLELAKEGAKGNKDGKVPEWEKEIEDSAAKLYGGTFENGQWSFGGSKEKENKYLAHRVISRAYYLTGEGSVSVADSKARTAMELMEVEAKKKAGEELDAGTIGKKQYDDRLDELMSEGTDSIIKQIAPKPADTQAAQGASLGRSNDGMPPAGAPADTKTSKIVPWEDFLSMAKERAKNRGMSDEAVERDAREYYDAWEYGGAAAPSAPQEPAVPQEPAAPAPSSGPSIPGISDANADESPRLARQEQNRAEEAAAEEDRRKEQRSGVKPETLKRVSEKKAGENKDKAESNRLDRGKAAAKGEQEKNLERYRKLKETARAKTMSKKELGLALLAAKSKQEKDDITRLLKGKR